MKQSRVAALITVAGMGLVAAMLYAVHPVKSSDHQDTYNLATRSNTSADITDVYVFPSPSNPANVVFAMDVSPLIPAGMGTAKFFDPTLMWQFKISHSSSGVTFVASTGSTAYNTSSTIKNGIQIFAGPRADPFYFDLFAFFSFLGDRYYATHTSQSDPGQGDTLYNGDNVGVAAQVAPAYDKTANPDTPTFNGFPTGTMSGTGSAAYACSTNPSEDALAAIGGGFNVLSYVVEVPRALLTTGYNTSVIHVWATVNSSTGA